MKTIKKFSSPLVAVAFLLLTVTACGGGGGGGGGSSMMDDRMPLPRVQPSPITQETAALLNAGNPAAAFVALVDATVNSDDDGFTVSGGGNSEKVALTFENGKPVLTKTTGDGSQSWKVSESDNSDMSSFASLGIREAVIMDGDTQTIVNYDVEDLGDGNFLSFGLWLSGDLSSGVSEIGGFGIEINTLSILSDNLFRTHLDNSVHLPATGTARYSGFFPGLFTTTSGRIGTGLSVLAFETHFTPTTFDVDGVGIMYGFVEDENEISNAELGLENSRIVFSADELSISSNTRILLFGGGVECNPSCDGYWQSTGFDNFNYRINNNPNFDSINRRCNGEQRCIKVQEQNIRLGSEAMFYAVNNIPLTVNLDDGETDMLSFSSAGILGFNSVDLDLPPVSMKNCPSGDTVPVNSQCPTVMKTCPNGDTVPVNSQCPTVTTSQHKICPNGLFVDVGKICPVGTLTFDCPSGSFYGLIEKGRSRAIDSMSCIPDGVLLDQRIHPDDYPREKIFHKCPATTNAYAQFIILHLCPKPGDQNSQEHRSFGEWAESGMINRGNTMGELPDDYELPVSGTASYSGVGSINFGSVLFGTNADFVANFDNSGETTLSGSLTEFSETPLFKLDLLESKFEGGGFFGDVVCDSSVGRCKLQGDGFANYGAQFFGTAGAGGAPSELGGALSAKGLSLDGRPATSVTGDFKSELKTYTP